MHMGIRKCFNGVLIILLALLEIRSMREKK